MQCIVCDKEVRFLSHEDPNQYLHPNIDGTMFEATGNYGSAVWDFEGPRFLQIVICDPCLREKAAQADVVEWKQPRIVRKELVSRKTLNIHQAEEKARWKEMNASWEKSMVLFQEALQGLGFEEHVDSEGNPMPQPVAGTFVKSKLQFDFKTHEQARQVRARISPNRVLLTRSVSAGTLSEKLDLSKENTWKEELFCFLMAENEEY